MYNIIIEAGVVWMQLLWTYIQIVSLLQHPRSYNVFGFQTMKFSFQMSTT